MTTTKNPIWKDCLVLTLLFGVVYTLFLGTRPLFTPDEGRYAEIAREMLGSGHFITPHLNTIKYFEKPPLFYWLAAIAMKVGGVNIWAARSVNAIIGVLGILSTYLFTRKLYNRSTGFFSALVLGTSFLYFVMAHTVSLDLPVSVFISITLFSFLTGTQFPEQRGRYYLLAGIFSALAVLTKGLIGIVFPGLIALIWMASTYEWRQLNTRYVPLALILFFTIATPWHYLVNQQNPEFFHFYFIEQHFLRFAKEGIGHSKPNWYFIPVLIAGFLPWIIFLPQALISRTKAALAGDKKESFFLIWAVVIFIFFSLSKSKLIPYILPIFPALAVLMARHLLEQFMTRRYLGIRLGLLALAAFSAFLLYYTYDFTTTNELPNSTLAFWSLMTASGALLLGSIATLVANIYYPRKTTMTLFGATLIFLIATQISLPAIDTRTVLPLANIIKKQIKPSDIVVSYNQYYQDLPFYLERPVVVLNWRNELTFGAAHQDASNVLINNAKFQRLWNGSRRVFVIMNKDDFESFVSKNPKRKGNVLGETTNNVLVVNR